MSETRTERAVATVFRPYTTLPSRAERERIPPAEFRDWLAAYPDALAGLLRQFRAAALDLGKLGFDDPERYRVYRSHVFDLHDRLAQQLCDWQEFWGLTEGGRVPEWLIEALTEGLL